MYQHPVLIYNYLTASYTVEGPRQFLKPILMGTCVEHGTTVSDGQDPGDADADPWHRHCELAGIDQGVSHSNVPVDGDEGQVEERRVTKCRVKACVKSAESSPKVPAALHGPDHAEGHHSHSH